MTRSGRLGLTLSQARVDRLDDALEGEPSGEVLLGCIPALGIDHPVSGKVLGTLARHPEEAVAGLHHRESVVEGLEVARQRP